MRAKIFIFVTLVYEVFDLPLVFKLKYANIYHKQADSNTYENDYQDLLNQWHNHCDLENDLNAADGPVSNSLARTL